MVTLLILATGAAVVAPSGLRLVEQAQAHATFLDFQRQVSALRLQAWREERSRLVPAAPTPRGPLLLESDWSYRLSEPLQIGDDGVCTSVTADLLAHGRVVMRLRSAGRDCRFIRFVERFPRSPSQ